MQFEGFSPRASLVHETPLCGSRIAIPAADAAHTRFASTEITSSTKMSSRRAFPAKAALLAAVVAFSATSAASTKLPGLAPTAGPHASPMRTAASRHFALRAVLGDARGHGAQP